MCVWVNVFLEVIHVDTKHSTCLVQKQKINEFTSGYILHIPPRTLSSIIFRSLTTWSGGKWVTGRESIMSSRISGKVSLKPLCFVVSFVFKVLFCSWFSCCTILTALLVNARDLLVGGVLDQELCRQPRMTCKLWVRNVLSSLLSLFLFLSLSFPTILKSPQTSSKFPKHLPQTSSKVPKIF